MFYPLNNPKKVNPYLLPGHCFDFANIAVYDENESSKKRFGSAVQVGLGTSFYLTDKLDLSISGQCMIHVGNDIHTYETTINGEKALSFDNPDGHDYHHGSGTSLEGHLLITSSLNLKIAELW